MVSKNTNELKTRDSNNLPLLHTGALMVLKDWENRAYRNVAIKKKGLI